LSSATAGYSPGNETENLNDVLAQVDMDSIKQLLKANPQVSYPCLSVSIRGYFEFNCRIRVLLGK